MSIFIDRKDEIGLLTNRLKSNKAEFLVIYGRRRVGKTELINKFLSQKEVKGIRLLAREESKKLQLKKFANDLAEFFNDSLLKKSEFKDWDGFFEYLTTKSNDRIVIALDEFPFLVKEEKAITSILQDYWDNKLKNSNIFLIICGSSISMMESLLGYKSPLYGRRTAQLLLKPLKFGDVIAYIKDIKKSIELYSVFGGTPAYLIEADINKNTIQNIEENLTRRDSFIYKDVEFVLRQELIEPRRYFSILLSIAKGNRKMGLICNDTGLNKATVNKYLSVLIDLQLVKRIVPVTENYKSKRGLYFLADNLFDFWFRFIYPYVDKIESGNIKNLINSEIKPNLSQYIGRHFEDVIIEILDKIIKIPFNKIGKWWYKDKEIDIVATNGQTKQILFAECKWKDKVNAEKILVELKNKATYVKWNNNERKEYYAIFAKSFSKKVKDKNIFCYDLKDLEKIMK